MKALSSLVRSTCIQQGPGLRDLLEEEEILSEEYRRVGDEARRHLGDARDQVAQYLEDVHTRFAHVERLRALTCLRAMQTFSSSSGGESEQDPDYEELLNSLEEDLQVVHTAPLPQVREVLSRWEAAIRKEVRISWPQELFDRFLCKSYERLNKRASSLLLRLSASSL